MVICGYDVETQEIKKIITTATIEKKLTALRPISKSDRDCVRQNLTVSTPHNYEQKPYYSLFSKIRFLLIIVSSNNDRCKL